MSDEELKVEAGEVETPVEEKPAETMDALLPDTTAPIMTMKKLLEAGSHYGHPTKRWNPKMKKYIHSARNGVYIIDLKKTCECITTAYEALKEISAKGGKVLFVGTKKQCAEAIQAEANRSTSFFITNRWLGGTLTNFKTIQSRIKYYKELEARDQSGDLDAINKKEAALLRKEKEKLAKNLMGISEMRRVPQALVVVDPYTEKNAILEANKLGIPVFGIVDTNANPDGIDYPIPANDDAVRSVALILAVLADAIQEAKGEPTVVAYVKDEGEEVTMRDVVKLADKENKEKLERIRADRKARQERYEAMMAEKARLRAERHANATSNEKKEVKEEVAEVKE